MLKMFDGVKPHLVAKPRLEVPRPDNMVFRLHYRVTFALLLVGSILVTSYQYIDSKGSAIQCLIEKNSPVPQSIINRFCWIQSTFTLPEYFEGEQGEDFVHFGVGPQGQSNTEEKVYHAYYQWVPLFLTFQAFCFYAPHWIWKQLEGGRLKSVVVGLSNAITDEGEREDKVKNLVQYMVDRIKLLSPEHRSWAMKFFFCECLNFINVIAQIFITDRFLGGEFTEYGLEVIKFASMEPEDRVDPMSKVFPKMTKCTFYKYGGSGTIQLIDAMCVLGMNILNEKVFIFVWFWFIILATISGVALVIRIVQLCVPSVRNRFTDLEARGVLDKHINRADIESVVNRLNYADWLVVYYLAQNMDKANFGMMLRKLAEELNGIDVDDSESGGFSRNDTMRSPAKLAEVLPLKLRKSLSGSQS